MKKILVITHAGGSPYHGPNMRWYNLGLALKNNDVAVSIVSSSYFHKYYSPPKVVSHLKHETIDGISYSWIKTRKYKVGSLSQILNQFEFIFKCYKYRNEIIKFSPDVVIASSPHPFVFLPAYSISKKLKIPIIYEVRDLWPELLVQLRKKLKYHPYILLLRVMERYAVKKANMLFSVKEGDYQYFEEFYNIKTHNFNFIANGLFKDGVSYEPIQPDFKKYRDKYGFLIVYTGAISAYYDIGKILLLADGLKDYKDIGIVLIGSGNKISVLENAIVNKKNINLHVLPSRKKAEIYSIIKSSDACYVSLAELDINQYGISCNKIYDYMYSSKPIVGHYKPSRYDPILLSGCGVVASLGEEDSLIAEILNWSKNASLSKEKGRLGKIYFDENYEFSVVAAKVKKELFNNERMNCEK